jgi:hypothetical protein
MLCKTNQVAAAASLVSAALFLLVSIHAVAEIQGFSPPPPTSPQPHPSSHFVPFRGGSSSFAKHQSLHASSSSSSSSSLSTSTSSETAPKVERTSERVAVIVGGGPVGLATALTLSNPPHSFRCIVLEKVRIAFSVACILSFHSSLVDKQATHMLHFFIFIQHTHSSFIHSFIHSLLVLFLFSITQSYITVSSLYLFVPFVFCTFCRRRGQHPWQNTMPPRHICTM